MSTTRNLMTNPTPTSTAGWVSFGGAEYRPTADQRGIYVRNPIGDAGRGIEYKLLALPAGDYVYGFHAETPGNGTGDQLSLIKSASDERYLCAVYCTHQSGFYTASFTLPEPGCKILFVAPKQQGGAMSVSDFILTPASEWSTVQALYESGGLPEPYFSGGSLPCIS